MDGIGRLKRSCKPAKGDSDAGVEGIVNADANAEALPSSVSVPYKRTPREREAVKAYCDYRDTKAAPGLKVEIREGIPQAIVGNVTHGGGVASKKRKPTP